MDDGQVGVWGGAFLGFLWALREFIGHAMRRGRPANGAEAGVDRKIRKANDALYEDLARDRAQARRMTTDILARLDTAAREHAALKTAVDDLIAHGGAGKE